MKYIFTTLLAVSTFTVCFSADLTRYQARYDLPVVVVQQPAIAQIAHLDQSRTYIVVNGKGEAVQQQFFTERKKTTLLPSSVEACIVSCTPASALADNNQNTTFDFPLASNGVQKGIITIVYAKPIETDSVVFRTTGDSYMPNAFTLVIDGKRVLNTISGSSVHFPIMTAQKVEIEFEYTQPIRFREVGVGVAYDIEENNMIRFVYMPETTYVLYAGTRISRETIPTPPINLFAKKVEVELVPKNEVKNPLYHEADPAKTSDSDGDSVIDIADNCPHQKNQDQKDGNSNGIGDICDDYDYDGVATYMDNCSEISNIGQSDVDRDGVGDVCDQVESRLTVRYAWIPWVVFAVVLLGVFGMGYEVVRKLRIDNK